MVNSRMLLSLLLLLGCSAACDRGPSSAAGEPDESVGLIDRLAGQTGDEGATQWRPPTGSGPQRGCPPFQPPEMLDSLEEETELGFSAADTLALVAGSHETRVRWNAQPATNYYQLEVTPGGGEELLQLTISHDALPPRYRAREPYDASAYAFECSEGQLELGVIVELRSENGTLDEEWWGELTASQASEAVVLLQAPTWRGRLPNQPAPDEGNFLNALEGTLDVIDADDPGSKLAWVDIFLRIRTEAIDGSVNGWVQTADGGAFLLPQGPSESGTTEEASWIGVIGDGYYGLVWGVE